MTGLFATGADFLIDHRPQNPVRCCRPFAVVRAATWFIKSFPGEIIYAVKANMSPFVIDALRSSGVTRFDVASVGEVKAVTELVPDASLFFMNPIKSRASIRAAYFDYGVRVFALDHMDELAKILDVTEGASDLTLFVRLSCNDEGSLLPLGEKYGARRAEAKELLQAVRARSAKLGVTFHVGSQALKAERFGEAILRSADVVREAGVVVDALNVGGGFPISYQSDDSVPLELYMETIKAVLPNMPLAPGGVVYAEPGRALVAEAESLIVRVDARRGADLYINDGAYGILYDAAHCNWVYPARIIGASDQGQDLQQFCLWGPSCDADDRMPGPFLLPDTIAEGDYIEIGKTGAYGVVMASAFNGFGQYELIEVEDDTFSSAFSEPDISEPQDILIKGLT